MVKICLQCRRHGFDPWVGKILWRRIFLQAVCRQPTAVFLPGKSQGQKSLGATVHGVTKSQTQLSSSARMSTWKSTYTHMFREALCTTAKKQKPPKGPATENQIEIYTCNGILFRNEVLTCATTWMSFKNNMLCERSQTQKSTCCVILFISDTQN